MTFTRIPISGSSMASEPERPDAEGASPIILQDAAVHGRVLARDVFEHGLRQIDFPAADYDA